MDHVGCVDDDLGGIIVSDEYHHFRMMRSISRYPCVQSLNIRILLRCCLEIDTGKAVLVVKAMNDFSLHGVAYILIQMAHDEVDIVKKVELPLLLNHRISENVRERDRVNIG